MVSSYLPTPDLQDAPPIVRQLREAFDAMLEELHGRALQIQRDTPDHATTVLHVPFNFERYTVEAMYDIEQDLFTQLVARPIHDRNITRPAYTISLFLVADTDATDQRRDGWNAN